MTTEPEPQTLLERLANLLTPTPATPSERRVELLETLKEAQADGLIDADALSMIEGVFQVGELAARDILIPRAQIDWIDINSTIEDTIAEVIRAAHSRFPVYENNRDNVIGILLAKDLLRHSQEEDFQLRDWLRPAVFIPESKRLSILLRDFRDHRNHIAIVVDEYGGVAGLVTIEDVLEQIVGDIEDEHDTDDIEDNIISLEDGKYRIRGITELDQVNEVLKTSFEDEDNDTLAGFILKKLGRVPHKGESLNIDNTHFEVQRADARQVHVLLASPIPPTTAEK
jgi:magnesium and cobalt transporter